MILEYVYQGPGTAEFSTYVPQIAFILLGAFLLGMWFRSLFNGRYKREIKDLEDENAILRAKSAPVEVDTSAFEDKINKQKLELTQQSDRINRCIADKARLENELVSAKNKLAMSAKVAAPVAKPAVEKKVAAAKPIKPSPKPVAKKTSKTGGVNDLKKIEGIGPKIASLLVDGGIGTFTDLSKASVDQIKTILNAAGPNYAVHDPSTWGEQAQLAANDEWDKLKALQDKLKGGRKA